MQKISQKKKKQLEVVYSQNHQFLINSNQNSNQRHNKKNRIYLNYFKNQVLRKITTLKKIKLRWIFPLLNQGH